MTKTYKTIRLILGDQLNLQHSWFQEKKENTLYVLMEMKQETDYTKHHIQKVVAFFLAMREMAKQLKSRGHEVLYVTLDDQENTGNLVHNLQHIIQKYQASIFQYQLPDEYRLDQQLSALKNNWIVPVESFDSEHFMTNRTYLKDFFEGKKQIMMEYFYRSIRKKYKLLMDPNDDKSPLTGKWNYDHENRGSIKKNHHITPPKLFHKDVNEIIQLLEKQDVSTMGNIDPDNFIWPTTYKEVDELLEFFLEECLPFFGKFQDAMVERAWSLYHSRISFAMNSKMISPLTVVNKAIDTGRKNQDTITIAQIEGFVRQIIGWREYMRGIYWAYMPEYSSKNYFNHARKLPSFYWDGNTKMNCMKHSIKQSLDFAYAHHIQRLMITGNFALLTGIDPDELDQWYLGIYIDAIEWVEITNTRGMSQFADGGIVGTKPYVSSANYINKMSDYCKGCYYDYKQKTGDKACPFNSLYWHFYEINRPLLGKNQRMSMMYRIWDKNTEEDKRKIMQQAEKYLDEIETL